MDNWLLNLNFKVRISRSVFLRTGGGFMCFAYYSTGLYFVNVLSISSVGCFHPATTRRDSVHIKPASIFYDDSNAFELMDLFSEGQMF